MTYEESLAFLHATGTLSRPGLERVRELAHRLGDVQAGTPFIHITGTNGKGSVSVMVESILRAAGYRTGLFTSPALSRMNEEIRIGGKPLADAAFASYAEKLVPAVDAMPDQPTEFERLTAMAMLAFRAEGCKAAVLEVGLGGRRDSTNIIPPPDAAVITAIGLEHTEYLGDTLEKIAAEKGGIIKSGCPVVLAHQSRAVEDTVRAICDAQNARLTVTEEAELLSLSLDGQRFRYRGQEYFLPLLGAYQLQNAAVALDTISALVRERGYRVPDEAIHAGLSSVRWGARMEVLRRDPLVLLDGAHNPNGIAQLVRSLDALLPGKKLTLVMGVMADKDYAAMLSQLRPCAARFIAATADYYRALPSDALAAEAKRHLTCPVLDGGTLEDALALALDVRGEGEAVCVLGTLYQAGAVRRWFGAEDA